MPVVGTTIKLTGQFTDFAGVFVTADDVKFIIVDASNRIIKTIPVADATVDNKYEAFYTVPSTKQKLKIKIYGLVDGLPEVGLVNVNIEG